MAPFCVVKGKPERLEKIVKRNKKLNLRLVDMYIGETKQPVIIASNAHDKALEEIINE